MADTISPEHRSWNMSRVRGKETKPEVKVRSLLHRQGFRFRKNVRKLPGIPDIVLPKHETVIFVHGCFWHQHNRCVKSHIPKTNVDYWTQKLKRNVERDRQHVKNLKLTGWRVITIWECQIKNESTLARKLERRILAG